MLRTASDAKLEPLGVENLRPRDGRTLRSWSDALEARPSAAQRVAEESVVRACRLCLAGSAMGFGRGRLSLSQMRMARPSGDPSDGPRRGAQSPDPFNRTYMHKAP